MRPTAKIDDRFAELQFHIGECLMTAGRFAEARDRFELARDLDVLRFRADSRINAIIREVAGEQEAAGVRLADAEQALECGGKPPYSKGISGEDIFYEHVHLTFDGNYLLARTVFDQVSAALPRLAGRNPQAAIPSRQRCAELLALTPWDESQSASEMVDVTAAKPFANQFGHSLRQAAARQRRDGLRRLASTPQAQQAAWTTYETAIAKAPDDWNLHRHFGTLALQLGRLNVAAEHFRIALEKMPWDASRHIDLGLALAGQGRIDEAVAHYQTALEIEPDDMVAHFNLGVVLAGRDPQAGAPLDEAIAHFRRALEIGPDFVEARFKLAVVLAGRGQVNEAIAHYQRALKIKPDLAVAHNNLGVILSSQGQLDEAIAHYRQAVEIKPDYEEAHNNLGFALLRTGAATEAMASFRKALGIKPDFAEAHYNLGVVLAGRGQLDEALAHFQKALEIKPGWAAVLQKMASIRATHPDLRVARGIARPGGQGERGQAMSRAAVKMTPTVAEHAVAALPGVAEATGRKSARSACRLVSALVPLRVVLFLALFAWILYAWVDLRLVFQWRESLFLWNFRFLSKFLARPGALMEWTDRLLVQLCYWGWPGVSS